MAEQCQIHLAQATASNSPCRRYSIILEELRSESRKESSSSLDDQATQPIHPDPSARMEPQNLRVGAIGSPAINTAVSLPYTSPHLAQTPVSVNSSLSVETRNPFMNWQTSDWLEIDASVSGSRACSADMDARVVATSADHACHQAYGMIPGYSLNPNVQWYGGGSGQ
jgi:hypothetical protein